ncbi:AbrB family transcriptional regulator [Uliginosibacterium paludis]|uniref:AbrB family transcriptional regulator n=1 Tax=Uliginosibacterium paludis TaxID=1615952 RepID=A0ABV2CKN3_9RHOO
MARRDARRHAAISPGGQDTVAVIAEASGVNRPFVMAFQTPRVLIVIMTGPMIARRLARHLAPPPALRD